MASREKKQSAARRLERSLPKLSPLMREAYASLWTTAQCDAAGRAGRGREVVQQANEWLVVADTALRREGAADVPFSRQRLAWLASLTVALEDELAGVVSTELADARKTRELHFAAARQLSARALSRAQLLVGGDEARRAALAMLDTGNGSVGEVSHTLRALGALLTEWRKEARLRLLAEELGLDEAFLAEANERAAHLGDAEALTTSLKPERTGGAPGVEGRVLKELRALQLAFEVAREAGLRVPALKVRKALSSVLPSSSRPS